MMRQLSISVRMEQLVYSIFALYSLITDAGIELSCRVICWYEKLDHLRPPLCLIIFVV